MCVVTDGGEGGGCILVPESPVWCDCPQSPCDWRRPGKKKGSHKTDLIPCGDVISELS